MSYHHHHHHHSHPPAPPIDSRRINLDRDRDRDRNRDRDRDSARDRDRDRYYQQQQQQQQQPIPRRRSRSRSPPSVSRSRSHYGPVVIPANPNRSPPRRRTPSPIRRPRTRSPIRYTDTNNRYSDRNYNQPIAASAAAAAPAPLPPHQHPPRSIDRSRSPPRISRFGPTKAPVTIVSSNYSHTHTHTAHRSYSPIHHSNSHSIPSNPNPSPRPNPSSVPVPVSIHRSRDRYPERDRDGDRDRESVSISRSTPNHYQNQHQHQHQRPIDRITPRSKPRSRSRSPRSNRIHSTSRSKSNYKSTNNTSSKLVKKPFSDVPTVLPEFLTPHKLLDYILTTDEYNILNERIEELLDETTIFNLWNYISAHLEYHSGLTDIKPGKSRLKDQSIIFAKLRAEFFSPQSIVGISEDNSNARSSIEYTVKQIITAESTQVELQKIITEGIKGSIRAESDRIQREAELISRAEAAKLAAERAAEEELIRLQRLAESKQQRSEIIEINDFIDTANASIQPEPIIIDSESPPIPASIIADSDSNTAIQIIIHDPIDNQIDAAVAADADADIDTDTTSAVPAPITDPDPDPLPTHYPFFVTCSLSYNWELLIDLKSPKLKELLLSTGLTVLNSNKSELLSIITVYAMNNQLVQYTSLLQENPLKSIDKPGFLFLDDSTLGAVPGGYNLFSMPISTVDSLLLEKNCIKTGLLQHRRNRLAMKLLEEYIKTIPLT